MRLAAIAGFATGTAIVAWTFLRQHSTSTVMEHPAGTLRHADWPPDDQRRQREITQGILEARERIQAGFAASNRQLAQIWSKDFTASLE